MTTIQYTLALIIYQVIPYIILFVVAPLWTYNILRKKRPDQEFKRVIYLILITLIIKELILWLIIHQIF